MTPLEDWTVLEPAMIGELQARGVATVEQLAELGDEATAALGSAGPMLRARAKVFMND